MKTEKECFLFAALSFPTVKLYVCSFTGTEKINESYSFKFNLVTKQTDFDPFQLLDTEIVFTLLRENELPKIYISAPKKVSQGEIINGLLYFTVEIVHYMERLIYQVNSKIYLDKTLPDIIDEIMSGDSFYSIEYEKRLSRKYPCREFSMQYNESNFNYLRYQMEDQGMYFFFDEAGDGIIFADSPQSHDSSEVILKYSSTASLNLFNNNTAVTSFELSRCEMPGRVLVRNYDWKDPNKIIVGKSDVREDYQEMMEIVISDKSISSQEEADHIAALRAEQFRSESYIGSGKSNAIGLRPGLVFTLSNNKRKAVNRDYMITEITHQGNQETVISFILGLPEKKGEQSDFYSNSFRCIPAEIPYRPERTTVRNTISGVINAFIDGDNAEYPVLDDYGRYKVLFPFDLSGRSDGKASCWIRRVQEQVGKDSGMTFPLLPGTEVVISFINGDPDRPVISGALSNGETLSLSGAGNKNFSGIRTPGGAQLTFDNDHNAISLANLTGSSITFGSGSMDYMQTSSHFKVDNSSVGSLDIASIFNNSVTGYNNNQMAICGDNWKFAWSILNFVLSETNSILSSLAAETNQDDANKNKMGWGASVTKMLTVLINVILSSHLTRKSAAPYNVQLSASRDFAASSLQCFPPWQYTVASVVAGLAGTLLSLATESVEAGKNEETYKKQASIRKAVTTNISSLLPEIAAVLLLIFSTKDLKKHNIGGIFINAGDKNINLHAKTYIGQHAERGIYLNTVEAEITPKTKTTEQVDKCSEWGSPRRESGNDVDPSILAVFTKIKDEVLLYENNKNISQFLKEGHINKRQSQKKLKLFDASVGNTAEPPQKKDTTFIAAKTHLHYTESDHEFHEAAYKYKINSKFIHLKGKAQDKAAEFSCYDGNMPVEVTGTFSVTAGETKDQNYPNVLSVSQSEILLGTVKKENNDNNFTHGLCIKENEIQLLKGSNSSSQNTLSQRLIFSDDGIRLQLTDNCGIFFGNENNKDYIDLYASEVRINGIAYQENGQQKSVNSKISIGNGDIEVKNVEKVQERKPPKSEDIKVKPLPKVDE